MKWPPHADDTKTPWVGEELGCSQAEGDAQILQDMTKAASLTLTPPPALQWAAHDAMPISHWWGEGEQPWLTWWEGWVSPEVGTSLRL